MDKYYEQWQTIGAEPARAYYVPFEVGQARSEDREDSLRFRSLGGAWKIRAYESVLDAEDFLEVVPEADIQVPSCVQYSGYDQFQYTNDRYPFMFDPPRVPLRNPAFHYYRTFDAEAVKDGKRVYILFEGVDSCFYLYINGKFAGFRRSRIKRANLTSLILFRKRAIVSMCLSLNGASAVIWKIRTNGALRASCATYTCFSAMPSILQIIKLRRRSEEKRLM